MYNLEEPIISGMKKLYASNMQEQSVAGKCQIVINANSLFCILLVLLYRTLSY